jgi:hypothetical protein
MNVNTISKMLIAFSVVMIFMAMNMDTTVSTEYGRVNNLGLLNDQSNMLILGGIGFLAGIILFATAKIKQTPEEEATKKLQQKLAIQKTKVEVDRVFESTSNGLIEFIQTRWTNIDNKKGRILTFLFCSIAFSTISMFYNASYNISDFARSTGIHIRSIENVFFLGFGLYALRPIKASSVMKHMVLFIMLLAAFNGLHAMIKFYDAWESYATSLIFISFLWGGISIIIFWILVRNEKKVSNGISSRSHAGSNL